MQPRSLWAVEFKWFTFSTFPRNIIAFFDAYDIRTPFINVAPTTVTTVKIVDER